MPEHLHIVISSEIEASIVIPSADGQRGGNVPLLLDDLRRQTFRKLDVIVVAGVKPQGKAINTGVARATGRFLIILDDDSRLPDPGTIGALIAALEMDPSIGMAGASIRQPIGANRLQRRLARELPRFHMPAVETLTDSDMPCHGCCAFRREVFLAVGGEEERLVRGLDPDLRMRLRARGYRVVLVPGAIAEHPLPATLAAAARMFFRNGRGSAFAQRQFPERVYDTDETVTWTPEQSLATPLPQRVRRFAGRLLMRLLTGSFTRASGDLVYAAGYLYECCRPRNTGKCKTRPCESSV